MSEILTIAVALVLLYGCEYKINYETDGQPHTLIVNPSPKDKP